MAGVGGDPNLYPSNTYIKFGLLGLKEKQVTAQKLGLEVKPVVGVTIK